MLAQSSEFITNLRTHSASPPLTTQGNVECPQAWHTFGSLPRGSGLSAERWPSAPAYRSALSPHHPLSVSSSPSFMDADPSTSTPSSNFASIINAALESYKSKTKKDLTSHPLLPSLQSCDSPEAILTVLREKIPAFNQPQSGDDRLTRWISPTVHVLYAFSATVGQGVGLVRIGNILSWRIPALTFNIRRSHRQMQSLRGSAFSSWSVSFMCRLDNLF